MRYKNLIKGEIGIIEKKTFKLDLQTCVGTILYGNALVEAAHGLIPEGIGSGYQNPLLVVPKGIEELMHLIKSKSDKNLRALLFGGKIEPSKIGIRNSEQARKILEKLKIPIKMDLTKGIYHDTSVMVHPDRFEVKSPGFKSILSRKFSELK